MTLHYATITTALFIGAGVFGLASVAESARGIAAFVARRRG